MHRFIVPALTQMHSKRIVQPKMKCLSWAEANPWFCSSLPLPLLWLTLPDIKCVYDGRASPHSLYLEGRIWAKVRFAPVERSLGPTTSLALLPASSHFCLSLSHFLSLWLGQDWPPMLHCFAAESSLVRPRDGTASTLRLQKAYMLWRCDSVVDYTRIKCAASQYCCSGFSWTGCLQLLLSGSFYSNHT